jgi:small-conductance mechanosensitive channel
MRHGLKAGTRLWLVAWFALAGLAHAADVPAVASVPAAPLAASSASSGARIQVMNRVVATLEANLLSLTPQQRADAAEVRIAKLLAGIGPKLVSTKDLPEGTLVQVDEKSIFIVTPGDTTEQTAEAARSDALDAAVVLRLVIAESSESRDLRAMLRAAGIVAMATAVLAALLLLLHRAHRRVERWALSKTIPHADRLQAVGLDAQNKDRLIQMERVLLRLIFWFFALVLIYEWLSITFAQFPYTRVWSEQLNAFLFGMLARFALAIVGAVPNLFAATLIFVLAYFSSKAVKAFFGNVQSGRIKLTWLDADVALITARLCTAAVWLFALAMAYPYLPGSQTEAFKGVSVLLGLMISLGASNLVGQMASGLILTYTRSYRVGEFVRVADHEGTVISLGTFTTRIRTGMGEELTISNSQVLGAVTRNYSRAVKGQGFIVDTTVTIGYDTPWRQVNAMLVEAALRTPGMLADPPPRVFQVALSDFYPEYRLVCQAVPSEPRPRAEIMSLLHANVQDVFNEHDVQIMSPHYLGDPAQAKVVPRDQWYAAPAKPPP